MYFIMLVIFFFSSRRRHTSSYVDWSSDVCSSDLAPREIVHQFLFAYREALDDPPLLPLKRFAFENLRNAAAQEIDSRLHVFFERIGLPARKGDQPRPVRQLEIVDVTAV